MFAANVSRIERIVSVAAGVSMVALAVRKLSGQDSLRRVVGSAGAGLVARGVTGYCPVNAATGRGADLSDTREALSGSRGIHIREAVTVARPAAELYELWRNLENLPRYMSYVEAVETIDRHRSRWTVRGPAGHRVTWDAEIINEVPGSVIGWRSVPGSEVVHAGSVRFREARPGQTEILVHLQYDPPAGRAGKLVATLLGKNPASEVREDLRRFKRMIETGEIPTAGFQPAGRRTATYRVAEAWE
jgi:uncharacterized membrane protein